MLKHCLFASGVLLLAQVASAQAGAETSTDREVFRTIVQSEAEQAAGVLLTDVRPIRGSADLLGIDADDLGPASEARGAVLRRIHLQTTDILADDACTFTHGLQVPPEESSLPPEMAEARARCRARPQFTSIAVGEVQGRDADSLQVRVVRVTTSRYRVVEYTLRRRGSRYRIIPISLIFCSLSLSLSNLNRRLD
jgi:hypothetical protein